MAKSNTATTDRPKAVDVLTGITEQALAYRFADHTPTLADIVRVVGAASRVLRYDDVDERISVENACVMSVAKRRNLIS